MTGNLQPLLTTLNQISVSGRENLDKLLACILEVERMMKETPIPDAVDAAKQRQEGRETDGQTDTVL